MPERKNRIELVLDGRVCDYGCGQLANFQFNNRKVCCSFRTQNCPAERKKLSHYVSEEARKFMSENGKGIQAWNKGLTKETDSRVAGYAKTLAISTKGRASWCKGLTKETDSRVASISESMKGEKNPAKRSGVRKKISDKAKIRIATLETREKLSKAGRNRKLTAKQKQKIRLKFIERLLKRYSKKGQVQPSYNFCACEFFAQFDKDFNTQGQYATNKKEFRIKSLGYWLDYINFDLKLIIEWDEEFHYDADGCLKAKDVQRQKEIQEYFPDFKFIRIREKFQDGLDYSFMKANKRE